MRHGKKLATKLALSFCSSANLELQPGITPSHYWAGVVHDACHATTGIGVSPSEELCMISYQLGLIGYSWREIEAYWLPSEELSYFPGWQEIRDAWYLSRKAPTWLVGLNYRYPVTLLAGE